MQAPAEKDGRTSSKAPEKTEESIIWPQNVLFSEAPFEFQAELQQASSRGGHSQLIAKHSLTRNKLPSKPMQAPARSEVSRKFFYLVERASADIHKGGWSFYAHAPEFSEPPDFIPALGTGGTKEEAINNLRVTIQVLPLTKLSAVFYLHVSMLEMHNYPTRGLAPTCRLPSQSKWSKRGLFLKQSTTPLSSTRSSKTPPRRTRPWLFVAAI